MADDVLIGGRGNDHINGGAGKDIYRILEEDSFDIVADSGEDTWSYMDWYYRGQLGIPYGDWTYRYYNGGSYNGGDGGSTYIEPLPELPTVAGNDYAILEDFWRSGVVQADTIAFGPGVTPQNIRVEGRREGDAAYLRITQADGAGVDVRLANSNDPVGTGIERFEFADGAEMTMAQMIALAPPFPDPDSIAGSEGNDALYGTDAPDRMFGLAGSDYIDAAAGDDFISGGAGNDLLMGGAGSDVYWFGRGDGADTISQEGAGPGDTDTICFGGGIAPSEITATLDWDGLHLAVGNGGDVITL
jgi:Ca2+-binding RTX toxin-like protein